MKNPKFPCHRGTRSVAAAILFWSMASGLASAAATQPSSYGAALSPQMCAPAGYVRTNQPGAEPVYKNGELHYCADKTDNPWKRQRCIKYVPADEYVKLKSGRTDARYSGMGLVGHNGEAVVLFYCLPPRQQY